MPNRKNDTYELPAPLCCPHDASTLKIVHDSRTHKAVKLHCPKCHWMIDLDLQRRIERHKAKMQRDADHLVALEAASKDLGIPNNKEPK